MTTTYLTYFLTFWHNNHKFCGAVYTCAVSVEVIPQAQKRVRRAIHSFKE